VEENALYILVADFVPIANKGEEAIVRGIGDMLAGGQPVKIGLFDNVEEVTHRDGITIFPRKWIFRIEGDVKLLKRRRTIRQILVSLEMRLGIYSSLGNIIPSSKSMFKLLQDFFERAKYVTVGHDGTFCAESCGIIHLAKKYGKCTGILGASTGIGKVGRVYNGWLYRRTMDESSFCTFREKYSLESMKKVCNNPEKLTLAPDPAFAMRAADAEETQQILERYEPYQSAKKSGRKIIAATVLEKGRIYNNFEPALKGAAKRLAHARYLAGIFDSLIKKKGAFVIFLPHSIEEDGNDIVAAEHVIEQMSCNKEDRMILNEDLGARLLKSIMRECDFLVGQRAHSLIGSVSVHTPFAALSISHDTRIHGIIGEMCQCRNHIIDIDVSGSDEAQQKVLTIFDKREAIRKSLEQTSHELAKRLTEVSEMIKSCNT
jgi:polysaccharide pyruvyl transferase WcaK-like protein